MAVRGGGKETEAVGESVGVGTADPQEGSMAPHREGILLGVTPWLSGLGRAPEGIGSMDRGSKDPSFHFQETIII